MRRICALRPEHLPRMSGKGMMRWALLIFTALLGAGLTLGALHAPIMNSPQSQAQPR